MKMVNRKNDPRVGRLHEAVSVRGIDIDLAIVDAVEAIWDAGIETYMSCQEGRRFGAKQPWVIFYGDDFETVRTALASVGREMTRTADITNEHVPGQRSKVWWK